MVIKANVGGVIRDVKKVMTSRSVEVASQVHTIYGNNGGVIVNPLFDPSFLNKARIYPYYGSMSKSYTYNGTSYQNLSTANPNISCTDNKTIYWNTPYLGGFDLSFSCDFLKPNGETYSTGLPKGYKIQFNAEWSWYSASGSGSGTMGGTIHGKSATATGLYMGQVQNLSSSSHNYYETNATSENYDVPGKRVFINIGGYGFYINYYYWIRLNSIQLIKVSTGEIVKTIPHTIEVPSSTFAWDIYD